VNHVLDFTKLSGNARSGGVDQVIPPTRSDLMQLIEEAVEGCWIGHRARLFTSEIGSVYSPPEKAGRSSLGRDCHVETVVDIGPDLQDWTLVFEKGGIRRVLMNLFGNSLKFTTVSILSTAVLDSLTDSPFLSRMATCMSWSGRYPRLSSRQGK